MPGLITGILLLVISSAVEVCAEEETSFTITNADQGSLPSLPEESPLFDGWSLGWDAGLTYKFDRVIPFPHIAPKARDPVLPDFSLTGRFGGSFLIDGGHLDEFADDTNHEQVKLRRGRLFTSGVYRGFFDYSYRVQFAVEGSEFFFNDFFIRHLFGSGKHAFQVGYMDPPVGMQALASIGDYGLMELPAPVSALAPGMRFGIQYDGTNKEGSYLWAVNLSTIGQSRQIEGEDSSSAPVRGSARFVFLPLNISNAYIDQVVHLGTSYSYLVSGDDTFRARARPESFLAEFVVDTGALAYDKAQTIGLELLNKYGPFTHQAEFLGTWVDRSPSGTAFLHGWYYECSYALSGDHRVYDDRRGILKGVESSRDQEGTPSSPRPYLGVIELSARYSYLNLQNGIDVGGIQRVASVGATWWMTKWLALRGEVIRAVVDGSTEDRADSIVQGRLQLQM